MGTRKAEEAQAEATRAAQEAVDSAKRAAEARKTRKPAGKRDAQPTQTVLAQKTLGSRRQRSDPVELNAEGIPKHWDYDDLCALQQLADGWSASTQKVEETEVDRVLLPTKEMLTVRPTKIRIRS